MKSLKTMNEKELREHKAKWPKTEKELMKVINDLVDRGHSYGTCVYAMSLAAISAFYYVASRLGVTSFQASCADLDFLKRTRLMDVFKIVDYKNMLYPQYEDKFEKTISMEVWKWLQEESKKMLMESDKAHPNVKQHWKAIADGSVPFGYKVSGE